MMQLLLLSIGLLLSTSVNADTCPGGQVRCPDFMTCCELAGGDFGCCPFPDAKCCNDHVHCCPHNMECDVAHQSCVRKGSSIKFDWQVPLRAEVVEPMIEDREIEDMQREKELDDLQQFKKNAGECPDKTECRSTFTCCKTYSGKYGCCPFNNATCCMDGFHCCPHGYQCSSSGDCYSVEENFRLKGYTVANEKYDKLMEKKEIAKKPLHNDVSDPGGLCPDGHPCPVSYTCCKISGKRYGCCPYSNARCCDDGIHCCPEGTNCNVTLGTCDVQKNYKGFFSNKPVDALKLQKVVDIDVICPDERYHCPSGSTCCDIGDGVYSCCPLERATCCSDKKHCCPYGYECLADGCRKEGHYLPGFLSTPFSEKISVQEVRGEGIAEELHVDKELADVICPDKYLCPDRNTCCQLAGGEYGCCPMEKATCCPDKIHCCPHDYHCIADGCRKDLGITSLSFLTVNTTVIHRGTEYPQTDDELYQDEDDDDDDYHYDEYEVEDYQLYQDEHEEVEVKDVVCPDKSVCPGKYTCCQLVSGDYGCCPYENATCCGDKEHCCPHGYWCSDDGCDRMPGMPQHLAPFLKKIFSARKVISSSQG